MNKNILFSTTRQWNPGDEFILFGVLNLFKEVVGNFNPIIFNRNPEVQQSHGTWNFLRSIDPSRFEFIKYLNPFLRIGSMDNSFKFTTDPKIVDLVVFAGSPEWRGSRLKKVYQIIHEHNIPSIYLGIGGHAKGFYSAMDSLDKSVLEKALLIAVRDSGARNYLAPLKPTQLPCPALLSVPRGYEKNVASVKRIALIFGTASSSTFNRITPKTYDFLMKLYRKIIEKLGARYEIEIVCHYIDEISEAQAEFPCRKIHYHYDSKEYFGIFKSFDLVIGHRVHGIGLSASFGIPGILISHDARGDTGKGFKASIFSVDTSLEVILDEIGTIQNSIAEKNRSLIQHKNQTFDDYVSLLKSKMASLEKRN